MTATPPHDEDAERIVLGCAMLTADAADEAGRLLNRDDFYRPVHGMVFAGIMANRAAGEPTDAAAIAHTLRRLGDLGRVGGAGELLAMIEAVPVAAMVGHYAEIVAGHATRRRLQAAGIRIADTALDPGRDPDDAVNAAHQVLTEATSSRRRTEGTTWGELLAPLTEEIDAAARGGGPRACTTGLTDLDKILCGGFRAGQLITVAGRPGMGKSVLVTDFARHVAFKRREPVIAFSLEMSKMEIGQRILAAETGIDLSMIQGGTDSDAAWNRIASTTGRTSDAPLVIEDSASIDLTQLRTAARYHRQQYGRLGLVVVDYLQLLTTARRYDNRVQEVSELSRGLKLLAKELECPVVAASQLNRANEARSDKRPQLSDLRESGSVEQDSDIVILLHRDEYYDPESPRAGEIDLDVKKNRNGPTGVITEASQLWCSRIKDLAIE